MQTFGTLLKQKRQNAGITQTELSAKTGIDVSLLSKFELDKRQPSKEQVKSIAKFTTTDFQELLTHLLANKIYRQLENEEFGAEALVLAEQFFPYKKGISEDLLAETDQLKITLDKKRPFTPAQINNLLEAFKIEYTFDSNRIEGNTLTLLETSMVVDKGLTISGKSMREHLEAINHAEAFDFILALAAKNEPVNERNILQIHQLVLRGIDRENAGVYRKVNVRIGGSKHMPPESFHLMQLMEELFVFYHRNAEKQHPVLLAADMHQKLVNIHPFTDGNGRTSRLLMNLIAYQNGFPMINISGSNQSRLAYYEALEKAHTSTDKNAFRIFILNECIKSLKSWIQWIG